VSPERTLVFDDGGYSLVEFDYLHGGVPVKGATIFFRANNGNLVQAGTVGVADIELDPTPEIPAEEAFRRALNHIEATEEDVTALLDPGSLWVVPFLSGGEPGVRYTGPRGEGYGHLLAWRFLFRVAEGARPGRRRWTPTRGAAPLPRHEPHRHGDGRGLSFSNVGNPLDETRPFPYCWVDNGGANNRTTDAGGNYAYDAASPAAAQLDGKYVQVTSRCGPIDHSTITPPGTSTSAPARERTARTRASAAPATRTPRGPPSSTSTSSRRSPARTCRATPG